MSETVMYKGVIEKVENPDNLSLEELCKRECGLKELSKYYTSYKEHMMDSEDYVVYKDELYFIETKEDYEDPSDIFDGKVNEDGSIDFTVRYYNGGCGFGEAIGYVLKKVIE